ncbi:sodium/potassium-transporting ATPase subunit beta-2-like [Leguminivora glycinivorella]|uniref:sodium/potassium-transporting ATPase subunit beta-2-like n=1 Tax=Leguminivora glycinivorella TaxID=1035111 RepID=UPI00200BC16B|nr:sodium/potassium-transporting ATPase subunit beta-2-like [Leguminivora glycinivorella]
MGLEKRTIKIIISVLVISIIIGCSLGLLFVYLFYKASYIELQLWPHLPDDDQRLIHFKTAEPGTWHPWVHRINDLLKEYETSTPEDPPNAPCSTHPYHEESGRSEACVHAMKYWHPCTIDTLYEYVRGTPCVFLRLAHIDQWTPQPYNTSMDLPIPNDMPDHLKKGLNHPSAKLEDYVWVSCKGKSPVDDENIRHIRYIPEFLPPGFPIRRLHTADKEASFTANDGGPLVAVLFQNLTRGVIISVECRIWTRDVAYDGISDVGRTTFELLVD